MPVTGTENAYCSPFGGGTDTNTNPAWRQHSTATAPGTRTILLPVPLRHLPRPPVPLPVLRVHPRQHLLRHPRHKQPLSRHSFFQRRRLAVHVYQPQVARDIITLECGRVYRHMRFAVQQPRFARRGGGEGGGGSV